MIKVILMKPTKTAILILFMLSIMLPIAVIHAQGPTASPTPVPTNAPLPTPTNFASLIDTPTPFALGVIPTSPIDTSQKAIDMAQGAINMYKFIDIGGSVDLLIFGLMSFLILRIFFKLIKSAKQMGR